MDSWKYLLLILYVVCMLKVVSSVQMQFDDIVGTIPTNDTVLRCSFTKNEGETIQSITIMARNLFTFEFNQIALFLPNQNGTLLINGQYLSDRVILSNFTPSSNDVALRFIDLQCDDETSFGCKITYVTVAGLAEKEQFMNLTVAAIPSAPIIVWDDFPIAEGQNVTFYCSGMIGKPPRTFSWQKGHENAELFSYRNLTTNMSIVDNSCFYTGTSNLTIRVTESDNNAVIRCSINDSNNEVLYSVTQALNVTYKVRKPRITMKHINGEYPELSGGILLTCSGKGNPKASYTWQKDGNTDEILSFSNTLHINNVITNNSGVYRCIVTNYVSGLQYAESTEIAIIIVPATPDVSLTTNQDDEESAEGIVFKVIAAVLLIALLTVVIVCCSIYRRLRILRRQHNYVTLSQNRLQGQENTNVQYDVIDTQTTLHFPKYKNSESTSVGETSTMTGSRKTTVDQRVGDGYEYPDISQEMTQIDPSYITPTHL